VLDYRRQTKKGPRLGGPRHQRQKNKRAHARVPDHCQQTARPGLHLGAWCPTEPIRTPSRSRKTVTSVNARMLRHRRLPGRAHGSARRSDPLLLSSASRSVPTTHHKKIALCTASSLGASPPHSPPPHTPHSQLYRASEWASKWDHFRPLGIASSGRSGWQRLEWACAGEN